MWLYVPGITSQSAPESADSTLESDWLCQSLAACCTRRGKSLQPKAWSRVLKTDNSTQRLCGRICDPSTAQRGVDEWIASLGESPVRDIPSPGSDCCTTTNEAYGESFDGCFAKWNPPTASWRTSQVSLFPTEDENSLPPSFGYSESWPKMGGMRNGSVFRRKTSERVSVGSEFFCWGDDAERWPTPKAQEDGCSPEANMARKERAREKHKAGLYGEGTGVPSMNSLSNAAEVFARAMMWQTPTGVDVSGRNYTYPSGDHDNPFLTLPGQAQLWSTPTAHDGRRPGPDIHSTVGANLNRDAATWATPRGKDYKGATTRSVGKERPINHEDLPTQAAAWPLPAFPSGPQVRDWVVMALSMTSSNFCEKTLLELGESIKPNSPTPSDGCESSKSDPTLPPR